MKRWICVSMVGVWLLSGCDNSTEACERARLQLSKDWSSVKKSAMKRKLGGVDAPSWATVENKADLLQSAFETRQVTWDSANNAQDYIVTRISSLKAEDELQLKTFHSTLNRAVKNQEHFSQQCR